MKKCRSEIIAIMMILITCEDLFGGTFVDFLEEMQKSVDEVQIQDLKVRGTKAQINVAKARYGTNIGIQTELGKEKQIEIRDISDRNSATFIIKKPIYDIQEKYDLSAARSATEEQAAQLKVVAQEVLFQNAGIYIDLINSIYDLQTAQAEKDQYEDYFGKTERKFQLGEINSSNVDQVRLTLQRKRIDFNTSTIRLQTQIIEISDLPPKTIQIFDKNISYPEITLAVDQLTDKAITEKLKRHPSFTQLEIKVKQSENDLARTREYFDPKINVSATYNRAVFYNQISRNSAWLTLGMDLPLYSGNSSFYQRQQFMINQSETKAEMALFLEKNTKRVKKDIYNILENTKQQKVLEETLQDAVVLMAKMNRLYTEGYTNSLELINSLSTMYSFKRQISQNKGDILKSKLSLLRSLGELTLANLRQKAKG